MKRDFETKKFLKELNTKRLLALYRSTRSYLGKIKNRPYNYGLSYNDPNYDRYIKCIGLYKNRIKKILDTREHIK